MAEEEEVEEPKKKGENYLIFIIILAAALIVSVLFFSNILAWLAIGAAVGLVFSVLGGKTSTKDMTLNIIVFALIAGLIATFSGTAIAGISKLAGGPGTVGEIRENFAQSVDCLMNQEKCTKKYEEYNPSTVKSYSSYSDNLNFINTYTRENQPIDVNAEFIVMNQIFDELNFNFECSINNVSLETKPSSYTVKKSSLEQSIPIGCKGDYQKGDLYIKRTAEFNSKSDLSVWIGKGEDMGKKSSTMDFNSPYKLSISLNKNQPLADGEYPLFIVLERNGPANLKALSSLRLSFRGSTALINCENMNGMSIENVDRETLKKDGILVDPANDKFMWKCSLEVSDAPAYAQESVISAEAIYTTEKDYKTLLGLIK